MPIRYYTCYKALTIPALGDGYFKFYGLERRRLMAISLESDKEQDGIPFVEDALSVEDAEASVGDDHESPAESLGMAGNDGDDGRGG
jgi:hypothetical protein